MRELSNLLNAVIKKGWKPFNIDELNHCTVDGGFVYFQTLIKPNELTTSNLVHKALQMPLRLVMAIESGLWQFCVENELTRWYNWDEWKYTETFPWDYKEYPADEYEYRLLESALTPLEELGKFLVDNIKA